MGMRHFGPTSHNFVSQRSRLHYVDWGNPDAPLLILIHGNKDHCRSWDWVAEHLCDRWHVVAPDLRGHGDSDWSPEGRYDFSSLTYDLAQLVFELGAPRAAIVAHSMGAHIALRYAGVYPETLSHLVAVEAVGAPGDLEEQYRQRSVADRYRHWIDTRRGAADRNVRTFASVDEAQARMQSENPWMTDERARHLTFHGLRRTETGQYKWKFDTCLGLWPAADNTEEEVFSLWQRIACPALLIYGSESWQTRMGDDLVRHVPDVRRIDMAGSNHWPQHDNQDRFLTEITAFLEG